MRLGSFKSLNHVLHIRVRGTGNEGRLAPQSKQQWIDWMIHRTERSTLRLFSHFRGRAVLPLGQPVYPIIEK